jgi:hypothetical protein
VSQFVNTNDPYPEAIPILIKYLQIQKDIDVLSGIARALTVKEAKGIAFEPLLDLYKQTPDTSIKITSGLKGSVANALAYLAEKKDVDTLCNLLSDKSNGPSRTYFIEKIASSANKENKEKIKKLLENVEAEKIPNLSSFAARALKRKKFLS